MAVMNRNTFACLVFVCAAVWAGVVKAQQQQQDVPEDDAARGLSLAEQADQHKGTVLLVLQQRATSVPSENAAEVAAVLQEASQQLDACAEALAAHQQIWQYKMCSSFVLQQGLVGLNGLQAASSAAAANAA